MGHIVTKAEVREHVETDLVDDALDRLIDDAEGTVDQRFGATASQADKFVVDPNEYPNGRDKFIFLSRPLGSITSISEQVLDDTPVVLSADDYDIVGDRLERLNTGTNPRSYWGHRVTATFTPVDKTASRQMVVIDLIKLEVEFRGLATEKAGDYQMSAPDYQAARTQVLNKLQPGFSIA